MDEAAAEAEALEAEALVLGLLRREPEFQSAAEMARAAFGTGDSVPKARIIAGLAALAERGWLVAMCRGVTIRGRDRKPEGKWWRYAIAAEHWEAAKGAYRFVGGRACVLPADGPEKQPEGGHMGPPLQERRATYPILPPDA